MSKTNRLLVPKRQLNYTSSQESLSLSSTIPTQSRRKLPKVPIVSLAKTLNTVNELKRVHERLAEAEETPKANVMKASFLQTRDHLNDDLTRV